MRKVFVRTQNVKNFISMMDKLINRNNGLPGMALVYGDPGLGKTQTILWWAAKNDCVFIRSKNLMTGRWLLEELVEELGEVPYYLTADLFKQCVRQLTENPRVIIVDEIDYLLGDNKIVETLRDIHDKTGIPIVLVGMGNANKKIARYRHLYDRLFEILKFEPFSLKDVKTITQTLCEIELTECAQEYIFNQSNRFRQIVRLITKAESIAETNSINILDGKSFQELMKDDPRENLENR